MNDKELMKKVYDKPCADDLSARELLTKSRSGAKIKRNIAAPIAAAVALVVIAGGSVFLIGRSNVNTDSAADPIDKDSSAVSQQENVTDAANLPDPDTGSEAVTMPVYEVTNDTSQPVRASSAYTTPYTTDMRMIDFVITNTENEKYCFDPNRCSDRLVKTVGNDKVELPRRKRDTNWATVIKSGGMQAVSLDTQDWGGLEAGSYTYTFELSPENDTSEEKKLTLNYYFEVKEPSAAEPAPLSLTVDPSDPLDNERIKVTVKNNNSIRYSFRASETGCKLEFFKGNIWVEQKQLQSRTADFDAAAEILEPNSENSFYIDPGLWQETGIGLHRLTLILSKIDAPAAVSAVSASASAFFDIKPDPENASRPVIMEIAGEPAVRAGEKLTVTVKNNSSEDIHFAPHEDGFKLQVDHKGVWETCELKDDLAFNCDLNSLSPGAEMTLELNTGFYSHTGGGNRYRFVLWYDKADWSKADIAAVTEFSMT